MSAVRLAATARQRLAAVGHPPDVVLKATACGAGMIVGLWLILDALSHAYVDFGIFPAVALAAVCYTGMGVLLTLKVPRHAAGWILLGTGAAMAFANFLNWLGPSLHRYTGVELDSTMLERSALAGVLVMVTLLVLVMPLYLPQGRLPQPSRRWRPLAVLTAISWIYVLILLSTPPSARPAIDSDSPLRVGITIATTIAAVGIVCVIPLLAVIVRFRQSSGLERQQMKWIAFPVALVLATLIGSMGIALATGFEVSIPPWAIWITLSLIPLGIAMAVLRHRLYSIDTLISRTIVYSAVTVILGTSFAVLNNLLDEALDALVGPNSGLAPAISAFTVAIAFGPVRRRIEKVVDRRLKPLSVAESLESLREHLAIIVDSSSVDALSRRLLADVVRAFDPAGAEVEVRVAGARFAHHSVGEREHYALSIGLEADGTNWGTLALGPRKSGAAYARADVALVREVASLAAAAFGAARHNSHISESGGSSNSSSQPSGDSSSSA